ncbi:MAG: sigma-70 family RNA polymerase sigma factor [Chthoniobacteraceae bacterium]
MARIKEGDRAAFTEFYDLHAGKLFGLISNILQDSKEAEDVLQEAFVYLWKQANSYDSERGKPLSWVILLFRHKAIDRLRARARQHRLVEQAAAEPLPTTSEEGSADEGAVRDERQEIVRDALAKMPEDQRQAIQFAFFRGLSQTQISDSLGIPLGTVKARIRRGLLKLRQSLKGKL